jgi:hypothetical protein
LHLAYRSRLRLSAEGDSHVHNSHWHRSACCWCQQLLAFVSCMRVYSSPLETPGSHDDFRRTLLHQSLFVLIFTASQSTYSDLFMAPYMTVTAAIVALAAVASDLPLRPISFARMRSALPLSSPGLAPPDWTGRTGFRWSPGSSGSSQSLRCPPRERAGSTVSGRNCTQHGPEGWAPPGWQWRD